MPRSLKLGLIAAAVAGYAFTAFAPATVSARNVFVGASGGTFLAEHGVKPYFIHITVADVLHNDPCHVGTNNIVCPVGN